MAYTSVAQGELDVLSDASPSIMAQSPDNDDAPTRRLSEMLNLLENDAARGMSHNAEEKPQSRVGSILKSITSSRSYQMVGNEDYEDGRDFAQSRFAVIGMDSAELPIRTASIHRSLPLSHPSPDLQASQGAYTKNVERLEESAERLSMSSSLEDELQRMKFEQRRPERQFSSPAGGSPRLSHAHSHMGVNTAARSGGYSPSGYITSPKGSIRSASWSQHSRNSAKESRFQNRELPVDLIGTGAAYDPSIRHGKAPNVSTSIHSNPSLEEPSRPQDGEAGDRPPTAASTDTYQKATDLFDDFDGVHYTTHAQSAGRRASLTRQVSLNRPPLANDSTAFRQPPPGENMVFYPAPVPMMLNLPQRLSKLPSPAQRERRRLQGISEVPTEMRQAAPWLRGEAENSRDSIRNTPEGLAGLPPQLRASAFFDPPAAAQRVEIKGASAVATLDSILDASAFAPVSAFTDHPIAGHLGSEVYGSNRKSVDTLQAKAAKKKKKKKRRSSLSNMLNADADTRPTSRLSRIASSLALNGANQNRIVSRESRANEFADSTDLRDGESTFLRRSGDLDGMGDTSIAPDYDEVSGEDDEGSSGEDEQDDDGENDDEEDHRGYLGPPTTLLAELQMRKAQQKLRNRTAAQVFPNGMHSTLLELDAVTQLQQQSRKQKHVTLAWEDLDLADRQNFDDEDVPLGLLAAGQKALSYKNRPMGLMEKRDMEDNEPLSQRRARLRGDMPQQKQTMAQPQPPPPHGAMSSYSLHEVPQLPSPAELDEPEDETLAQRAQRIKAEKERATGGDFAVDVSSQLGLDFNRQNENIPPASKTPDAEETLGQRRKRLKEEASRAAAQAPAGLPVSQPRHSMADLLSAHPAGAGRLLNHTQYRTMPAAPGYGYQPPVASATMNYQVHPFMQSQLGMPSYPAYGPHAALPYVSATGYGQPPMAVGMGMPGYAQGVFGVQDPMMGPPLDTKQRAQIDLWRQSVAQ